MSVWFTSDEAPTPTGHAQRRAFMTLIAVVLAVVAVSVALHIIGIVAGAAVIAAVIMLHEAGHFVAAKLSGMKVTGYYLGFGPRLWAVRKGETEYGVRVLPLGGYVRIVGMHNLDQTVDPLDEPRTYRQQSFPRRLAVAVAGSTVHFVLAILAMWAVFSFGHQAKPLPVVDTVPPLSSGASPAEHAGIDAGDRILAYDGIPTHGTWTGLHTYIQNDIGKPITLDILRSRGGHPQQLQVVVTPIDAAGVTDQGVQISTDHVGFVGITVKATNYSLLGSVPHSLATFWTDGIVAAFHGLGQIFSPHGLSSLAHQVVAPPSSTTPSDQTARPTSLVGVVHIAGELHGWPAKLWLFFMLNAFVGLFNLFPLLPFDGGHVSIAVYERLRSRSGRRYFADITKMLPYSSIAMALLIFVSISSVYLDVFHPITLR